ncbi:LytTR family DNA-binding domain-containing protein [Dyadobacter sp. CY312]|uniref:LytR/AlgR family response regulator transcription factor n=1 Tax=Dyadobacter sp. CY312 TaxID=2907303 RepID=UPI001F3CCA73|nr:LytTR family DNA-binding domain-containing protein [Dyadobacter sp. CY312]MCE7042898.1 LytTR family DNA-binding domain-containing protein [Dyadobacter sp. CY312]
MATAYIIDDELHSGQLLKAKIKNLTDYFTNIELFVSSTGAYRAIVEREPDIIFMDIEMPQMSGIDIIENIKHLGIVTIYVTAFNNYSITAIKQQVFDYILKPVKEQELLDTINKFIAQRELQGNRPAAGRPSIIEIIEKQNSKILVHTIEGINLISINLIVYIEGEDNYSRFIFQDGSSLLSSRTLKYFERQLEPFGFIRVHKSHLVNIIFVEKLITRDGGYLYLRSANVIPFARDKKAEILEWFKI